MIGLLRHQMPLGFRTHEDVRRRMLFGWLRHQAPFRFRTREDLQLGWLRHQAPFRFRTHEDLQIDSGLLRFESFDLQCDLLTIIKMRRLAQPSLLLKGSAGSDVSLSLEAEALGERVRGDGLQVVSWEMGSRWCLRRWAPEAEIGSRW